MRSFIDGQHRLIQNVTGHHKNPASKAYDNAIANGHASSMPVLQAVQDESERNERLAKQMSRSQFLGVGENPPSLACEGSHQLLQSNYSKFAGKNEEYINDESIPPHALMLVEKYRNKVVESKDPALVIDQFFTEMNSVLKDVKMREIARINNENDVAVNRLQRIINQIRYPDMTHKGKS